ncbi:MAG: recombinase zinc beta ribbon domain-containing protein [Clostridia bacterium]|nr:recombinase zinc beta ribbon domain-containing protein [Clostridia bacterium]MBR2467387.1 recombinase zinc beta ribbon domain-containing protein [Clostridia bacterium]
MLFVFYKWSEQNSIFSGKLVCGLCKHKMSGESGISQNSETHYYYVCVA